MRKRQGKIYLIEKVTWVRYILILLPKFALSASIVLFAGKYCSYSLFRPMHMINMLNCMKKCQCNKYNTTDSVYITIIFCKKKHYQIRISAKDIINNNKSRMCKLLITKKVYGSIPLSYFFQFSEFPVNSYKYYD